MGMSLAQKHVARFETLKTERNSWDNLWQDTLDHVLPRKADVNRYRQPGSDRGWELLDSTGEQCNELLAGTLHSTLTNPEGIFFELTTGDLELDQDDDNRIWLSETGKQMHHIFNNSNFQTEIHEIYMDLCSIGTACLLMEKDDVSVIRFTAKFMGDVFVAENRMGVIDTMYIRHKWKYRDATLEWPDNAEIAKLARETPDAMMEVVHCVGPREDRVYGKRNSKNKAFGSMYVWVEKKLTLSEGGYDSFPAAIPRWTKATGETYGRSPGMKVLPDVRLLQEQQRIFMMASQKEADPVTVVPDEGYLLPLDTNPGGFIYKRPGADKLEQLRSGANFPLTASVIEKTQAMIKSGYFIDRIQLVQGPQQTATEVLQRTEENMRILGPMLGRQHNELLRPLINRAWDIMVEQKMLKPVPASLKGKKIDVHYTSIVARAQRSDEAQNLQRALSMVVPFAQSQPNILDNIDGDEVLRYGMNLHGVPARVLRKKRDVIKIRDDRNAAAQAQAEAANAASAGENAKNLAPMAKVMAGAPSDGSEEEFGF